MEYQTLLFKDALRRGALITICSCQCGGQYAWLIPKETGVYEMYGCICHNKPPEIVDKLETRIGLDDDDFYNF